MRILLVEDDPEIGIMLKDYLETENFEVVMAHDGGEACDKFAASRFDLVLLDLMIPVVSGMDVLQRIRKDSVVPVIIVSAKDSEADKMLGLGLGADDYITKPFSVAEVLARVKANIRRFTQYNGDAGQEDEVVKAGEIEMNLADYTVTKAGSLEYVVGDRVRHVKFGEGQVTAIVEGGRDYEVTVEFDKAGPKKMFASFAKLKKV